MKDVFMARYKDGWMSIRWSSDVNDIINQVIDRYNLAPSNAPKSTFDLQNEVPPPGKELTIPRKLPEIIIIQDLDKRIDIDRSKQDSPVLRGMADGREWKEAAPKKRLEIENKIINTAHKYNSDLRKVYLKAVNLAAGETIKIDPEMSCIDKKVVLIV